jgi:hypothetical protein
MRQTFESIFADLQNCLSFSFFLSLSLSDRECQENKAHLVHLDCLDILYVLLIIIL